VGAFTIGHYLDDGAGVTENTDVLGFDVHGVIGQYVIPVLVLVLLVVALIGRAGVKWAAWLLLAVVVQIALAYISFGIAWVGFVHGVVAFAVAGLAETAARTVAVRPERARPASAAGPASPAG
jgi:hypothetical protein